jgi:polysaccharide biosynthesis transport protein
MSKNFELLSQLEGPLTMLEPRPAAAAVPGVLTVPRAEPVKETTSMLTVSRVETGNEAASEEENTLVQRVFFLPGQDAPRAVVFCGVDQGDSASSMCARVSEILAARVAGRVCLIDADRHSPSLHAQYGIENPFEDADGFGRGGAPNASRQIRGGNLWLSPVGSRTAGGELIAAPDCVRSQIADLRQQFDYVLISAPAVNLSADAIVYGQLADGVILVLKAGATRRAAALKAKESLEASNVKLLGAILSERTFPIPEALYRML